jgi:hypothetical protein
MTQPCLVFVTMNGGQWYLCEVPAATAIPPAHEVGLAQARVRHPTREELRLPLTAL